MPERPAGGGAEGRGFGYSEQHRHECEVRYLLSLASRAARVLYLEGDQAEGGTRKGVRQIRGDKAADRLRADVEAAWSARTRLEARLLSPAR